MDHAVARKQLSTPYFIKDVIPTPLGFNPPRPAWVRLKRLQTRVGLFRSKTYKRGVMASTAACECGAKEQTDEHIITSYPI